MVDPGFVISVSPTGLAEKTYIIRYVLGTVLGQRFDLRASAGRDIVLERAGKRLELDTTFFDRADAHWLREGSLPRRIELRSWQCCGRARRLDRLPILFGEGEPVIRRVDGSIRSIRLPIDVLGTVFFLVSRYEEAIAPHPDPYGRVSAHESIAYRNGFLERAVGNEYIEVLWDAMVALWPDLRRPGRRYRLILTHDVDLPFLHYQTGLVKAMARVVRDLVRGHSLAAACAGLRTWRNVRFRKRLDEDPYYCFDYMLDASREAGVQSEFYFIAARDRSDMRRYDIDHPAILELLGRIAAAGSVLGLHATRRAYRSGDAVAAELARLKRTCGRIGITQPVWGGRQHYLSLKVPDTFRAWDQAGAGYDSSLCFHDHAGFRAGLCYPYPVYDLEARRELRLEERPLVAMEASVIDARYMGLGTGAEAFRRLRLLRDECEKYGGDFVLLWHNSRLVDVGERALFERTIGGARSDAR